MNHTYFSSVVGKLSSVHGLDMETLYKKKGKLNLIYLKRIKSLHYVTLQKQSNPYFF